MPQQNMLSQDEVDALLAGVTGDDEVDQSNDHESANGVSAYDLGSPDKVVRHRMQSLEFINEKFARRLRSTFFTFMRRNADITVSPVKIQTYSDFKRNLPIPSNLNMVGIKPLRGVSLFTFDPNLVFLVIDNLFGGHGKYTTRVEGRDFTNTEQRIIRRLLGMTMDCYTESWTNVYPVELEYIRSEMHTKFASIGSGNDVVVVSKFTIELGSTGGIFTICIPYSMLEPIRDILTRPLQHSSTNPIDQRWMTQLSKEVRSAEVELAVEFNQIESSIAELTNLKVGDVLPIDLKPNVIAKVGGVPVLECNYGTYNGHYALSVKKTLTSASDSHELLASKK